MKHRHNGPMVKYKTARGRIMHRKRPTHNLTIKQSGRRGVRRMAWDIEGAKEELHRIEYISPEEYVKRTGVEIEDLFPRYYDTEKDEIRPIEELGEYIKSPDKKVRIPFVGDSGEHEGRHRAYAAMLEGQEEIPVAVPLDRSERKSLGEEFVKRAFPDSGSDYQQEWIERFNEGFPESAMDKERRQIYKEILEENEIKEPEE